MHANETAQYNQLDVRTRKKIYFILISISLEKFKDKVVKIFMINKI